VGALGTTYGLATAHRKAGSIPAASTVFKSENKKYKKEKECI